MMQIPRLSPPRLRTVKHDDHRAATWLELFYDLTFVVAVGQLGHRLAVNHGVGGVWGFIGLFVPLWWTWASYTFYADRYDTDDLGQRIATSELRNIMPNHGPSSASSPTTEANSGRNAFTSSNVSLTSKTRIRAVMITSSPFRGPATETSLDWRSPPALRKESHG